MVIVTGALLYVTDLNAAESQYPTPYSANRGTVQPQQLADAFLLSPRPDRVQDAENGDRVEENIVYL